MSDIEAVLREHGDAVWQTIYRIWPNESDARDCYQQTFLDVMRIDESKVKNWRALLCRIATRRAMDQLRRKYRNQERFSSADVDLVPQQPSEDRLAYDELRRAVRDSLAQVPPSQSEAFWLRHVEQLSPVEIAEQMNIQAGHVRVLVHRAIEHLRRSLNFSLCPQESENDHEHN